MAYNPSGLSAISYANGFTLWHYRTVDDSVATPGYFDPAHKMLRVGDFIMVNLAVDTARQSHCIICIVGNDDSSVSVAPMVAVGCVHD
jgi:hypothetical protein